MGIATTDGSKLLFGYAAEATPGVAPTGTYKTLRSLIGTKFDLNRSTFTSKERRSDRQESSMSYGNKSGSASIPIEWSYGSYDDFLEAVLGGTWSSNVLKVGNIQRTFGFEETSPDLDYTEQKNGVQFTGFSISQKVNAIATGDFTGLFRDINAPQTKGVNLAYDSAAKTITRSTAGFITVDNWAVGDAVVGLGNADAGNNNTTPWIITTLTDTVMTFTTATGIVTKTAAAGITLNQGTQATTLTAASTTAPFDSFSGTIQEGGVTIGYVTGWDLKVDQASQPNYALGSDAAQSISIGTIKVTGNLAVYYIDQSMRKKFLGGTSSSLSLKLGGATSCYQFDLGTVKYTSNTRDDVELARTETLAFQATYDSTNTSTLKITRTP